MFGFSGFNGRSLIDNAPDVMFSLAANTPVALGIGKESVTSKPREAFPYVPAAGQGRAVNTTLAQGPDEVALGRRRPRWSWPIAGMAAVIIALHLAGWLLLAAAGEPDAGGAALSVGIGVTAYTLGLRHAFDADHIAAIDTTTRKIVGDGGKPVSVGFWFSLGHSTIVFTLTLALALGARALTGPLEEEDSTLHQVTGIIGTGVSGVFLYVIAGINLALLIAAIRTYRRVRSGEMSEDEAAAQAAPKGPLTRMFAGLFRSIRRPWQMYPIGVLFGFGFDTATEIGLLVLAATGVAAGVPWYALLSLPLLFAAGMSLLDTTDGLVMRYVYGWAFGRPRRRMTYDIAVTALSVAVAFIVGSIEILALFGDRLSLGGAFRWFEQIDLNALGFGIVGLFMVVWGTAVAVARIRRGRNRTTSVPDPAP